MGIAIPSLLSQFRITAAVAFLIFVLLYAFQRLHCSRRTIYAAFAFFIITILVPVDVYVSGFHGRLIRSQHSGLRLVRVYYVGDTHSQPDGEFIAGGRNFGPYDSRWRLVWD